MHYVTGCLAPEAQRVNLAIQHAERDSALYRAAVRDVLDTVARRLRWIRDRVDGPDYSSATSADAQHALDVIATLKPYDTAQPIAPNVADLRAELAAVREAAEGMREALRFARDWHDDGTPLDCMSECERKAMTLADAAIAAYDATREAGRYVIKGTHERDDETGAPLYWSNQEGAGWGLLSEAETYTEDERNRLRLPVGGEWAELAEERSMDATREGA